MQYTLAKRVRQILLELGPVGTRFIAADVGRHFVGGQRNSAVTALQRFVRQGEVTIVEQGNGHGKGRVYATAEVKALDKGGRPKKEKTLRPRAVPKPKPEKKVYPTPAWASAWPKVYEGFKQRQEQRV